MYVCMYVCMHVYVYTCVYMLIYIYIYIYVCVCVNFLVVCMHACVYTFQILEGLVSTPTVGQQTNAYRLASNRPGDTRTTFSGCSGASSLHAEPHDDAIVWCRRYCGAAASTSTVHCDRMSPSLQSLQ